MSDRWSTSITRVLAPNPGPMTLDGTNTLVLRGSDATTSVVVDPGPLDDGHLARLEEHGPIAMILITHRHQDHIEAVPELHRRTGAPVRAADATLCADAPPLVDGEILDVSGVRIEVVATPGHTDDSVCFRVGADGAIITGDTILGRGSTVIADTGTLGDYLRSLEKLRAGAEGVVIPAHGERVPSLHEICDTLLAHRHERLAQVEAALAGRPAGADDDTVRRVLDTIYGDVDPRIRYAAEMSTRAQLAYLAGE